MKDELGKQIGLKANIYSYSWYSNDKNKNKTKGERKSAMKQKLKFWDYEKCS